MSTPITKRTILAAGAGLVLVPLFAGLVLAVPDDKASIDHRLQQYETRVNAGDAEAVSELFSEDVVYYGPLGRVFEGRDAVAQHYQNNMTAGFTDMKIDVIEIEIFGDTAYDVARYTITSPAGKPLTGYHLAVLTKEDGEWIVQRTLVNAVMPPPPGG